MPYFKPVLQLLLLSALVFCGAEVFAQMSPRDVEDIPLFTTRDIPYLLGGALIIIGLLAWAIWHIHNQVSEQWEAAEVAEERFARKLAEQAEAGNLEQHGQFESGSATSSKPFQPPHVDRGLASGGSDMINKTTFAPIPSTPNPSAVDAFSPLEDVVNRLRKGQAIGDKAGEVQLSVAPHGEIYARPEGGYALVLPRLDSPEAMAFFSKRYDTVYVALPDGGILTMQKYEPTFPTL